MRNMGLWLALGALALLLQSAVLLADQRTEIVRIVVVGATGDLAAKYLWVACFRLALEHAKSHGPHYRFLAGGTDSAALGAKWKASFFDSAFLRRVCGEDQPQSECHAFYREAFVPNVRYVQLRDRVHYGRLAVDLAQEDDSAAAQGTIEIGRLVYLAIPPKFFLTSGEFVHEYLRPQAAALGEAEPFLRVVVEKPFGRDLQSAQELARGLDELFSPDEIYVMDHYAGKPVVQAFGSFLQLNHESLHGIWNGQHIESIEIHMSETETCENRIQFFHSTGIIRDVMVNHLQLLLGITVRPALQSVDSEQENDVMISFIDSLQRNPNGHWLIGQYDDYKSHYQAATGSDLDEEQGRDTIFAATAAFVELESALPQWKSTKFILSAAKATDRRDLQIRIRFKDNGLQRSPCEMRISIQKEKNDEESASHRMDWTCEGSDFALTPPTGWVFADSAHNSAIIRGPSRSRQVWEAGDEISAYDILLRDVLMAKADSFMNVPEVLAAWKLWTPIIHEAETTQVRQSKAIYRTGQDPWETFDVSVYKNQRPRGPKDEL